MKKMIIFLRVLGVLVLCASAWAVDVLEPDYVVETYASYSDAGIQRSPWDMVFADDGNLYLTQLEDNSIWRITPDSVASELVSGVVSPTGIVWAAGTSYGDYLYVAITSKGVIRVGLDGATWDFANRYCAGTLGLDRTGNYGGYMYTTTGCQDHTYRVHTDGSVTMFTSWPTWIDGGGPHNIAFDNGGNYGGLFFVAASYTAGQPHVSGLFTLDPGGNATRFTPDIVQAHGVDFDPAEAFGGDMFVIGKSSFDQLDLLWRVSPDGIATEFATLSGVAPRGLTFGPDGAMYVGEYISQSGEVIISRIMSYTPREIDIKPGSCPNPLNVKSWGILPVAILGSEDFDVTTIDVASIRLAEVAPIRSSYKDIATPVSDENECECTTEGPDGYLDLTLKFETQEIVNALGEVNDGDVLALTLTGMLYDRTPIEGADCILVRGKFKPFNRGDINKDGMVNIGDFAIIAENWLQSSVVQD